MNDIAIRIENISKVYRLGAQQQKHDTLRDAIGDWVKSPFRQFRRLSGAQGPQSEMFHALRDISFDIKHGEVVGLIGRNGAGKSTLLKIISRITEPTTGRAELYGRVGTLLEVGTGFHPELSGRENIYLNGSILGMRKKEIEEKFDQIVEFSGIERFLDTPVKRYSSGMFVRLAFAVAAHLEPEILIVDEVLAVGDAKFQKSCLGKMKDVAKSGRTVVFVSHNMQAIRALCDRCVLLSEGQVVMDGKPEDVISKYLSANREQNGEKVWEEGSQPGNESFRIRSVRLKNSEGETAGRFPISKDIHVEIEYDVLQDGVQMLFSLVLFDSMGNCLFGSLNNHEENFYSKSMIQGRYSSCCSIYGNLLNEENYSISLIVAANNWSAAIRLEDVLSFEAEDDGYLRKDYYGGYGGCIRPKLLWMTEAV